MSDPASSATGVDDKSASSATDTVAKADHERALEDLKKFKAQATENERLANDLKTRLAALETDAKSKSGDFKGLYETTKAQLDEAIAKEKKLKDSMVLTQKHSAVQTELLKSGFKSEFLTLLDKENFDDVVFEVTSQGRMLVTGADTYAQNFRKKYPSAFEAQKAPTFNNGGGKGGGEGQELTIEYMNSIEKTDPKKYKELFPKFMEEWKKRRANPN